MTARTHDTFAFASLVAATVYYPPSSLNILTLSVAIVGNIVGCLLPDMDQTSNRLWDLLPQGNFLGRIFRRLFLSHRTLSHSLLGCYLLYKGLEWILPRLLNSSYVDPKIVLASIMIGFVSHLIADSVTKEGLPLFFPIRLKFGFPPIKALRVTTGSWFENLVILPGIGVYLIWFIDLNKDKLIGIINLIH